MEIEIKISKENLKEMSKILAFLLFIFYSFFIFVKNNQVVQDYPIVFGDEGLHMRIAKEIAQRKEYLHYLDFFVPNQQAYGYFSLFHFIEAFGFLISEEIAKLFLPLTIFLISFSIFVIFYKLFDEKIALISAILFQTFQSTVIYSVTFYVDALLVLFSFLSFGFLFLFKKEKNYNYLILSSIFLSLTFLTKPVLPFAISIGIFSLLLYYFICKEINFKLFILYIFFPILSIFSVIFMNIFVYNKICVGLWILSDFLNRFLEGSCEIVNFKYEDVYKFSGRTEQVGSELDVFSFGLKEYIDFSFGYSSFIILTSIIGIIYLFYLNKYDILTPLTPLIFLTIVWLIVFYPIKNDLGILYRAEDTARYLLFLNPFVALYVSIFFIFIKDVIYTIFSERKAKSFFTLLFLISVILISYFFYISYSQKLEIMKRVKSFSDLFFYACEWVKKNLDRNTTLMSLWGYRVLYACERNVGGFADLRLSENATFINELAKRANINYFFIEKFSIDPLDRNLSELYNLKWVKLLLENKDYFEVVYENGIPIEKCINEYLNRGLICDGVIIFRVK